MRKSDSGGLVYSTEGGRMCPVCRTPAAACACRAPAPPAMKTDGIVRVARESKGRGGKTVTVVRGLALDPAKLVTLGQRLRAACGSGGTVKDGAVEVQGDHCVRVIDLLEREGWTVKLESGAA